jgi:hypothetical protein
MRNGSGDEMFVLFREEGCVINGFAHEYKQPDKAALTQDLPPVFLEFVFGEPTESIGTTFCLWTTEPNIWRSGKMEHYDDNSDEMLKIFDGQAQTYVNWATEYFEGSYRETGIPVDTIASIYSGKALTREMVLAIVNQFDDWEKLKSELTEIDYPFDF